MAARRGELTLASLSLKWFVAYARSRGLDPGGVLARHHVPLDVEEVPSVRIALATLREVQADFARALDAPQLGLDVAAHVPRGAYGALELLCRAAPSIRAAAEHIASFGSLLNELAVFAVEDRDDATALTHHLPGEPLAMGREGNEFHVATFVALGARLAGAPLPILLVRFAHPAPADAAAVAARLGTRVEYGGGRNEIVYPAGALAVPIVTADPPLHGVLQDHAEVLAQRAPARRQLRDRVARELEEGLVDRSTSVERVAQRLKMSGRTLQRGLAEEGTSFQAVLDDVRAGLATTFEARGMSASHVARRLGYANVEGYRRASRRWRTRSEA